jgi:hypothetical protein
MKTFYRVGHFDGNREVSWEVDDDYLLKKHLESPEECVIFRKVEYFTKEEMERIYNIFGIAYLALFALILVAIMLR